MSANTALEVALRRLLQEHSPAEVADALTEVLRNCMKCGTALGRATGACPDEDECADTQKRAALTRRGLRRLSVSIDKIRAILGEPLRAWDDVLVTFVPKVPKKPTEIWGPAWAGAALLLLPRYLTVEECGGLLRRFLDGKSEERAAFEAVARLVTSPGAVVDYLFQNGYLATARHYALDARRFAIPTSVRLLSTEIPPAYPHFAGRKPGK